MSGLAYMRNKAHREIDKLQMMAVECAVPEEGTKELPHTYS